MISVNGVVQEPDPSGSAGFKLLGSNIVFSSAPANGHAFFGVINAGADYVTAGSEFPDGSATAPSFTFQDDQDTGWFRNASGDVGYSSNGAAVLNFDGNGLTIAAGKGLTVDTSTLYVDATNNRVGIGTTSPGRKLVIKNTGGQCDAAIVAANDDNSTLFFGDSDADNRAAISYKHASDSFSFKIANTLDKFVIDSSGKVGIGETSMDALLVIKGDSDANTTPSIRLKDGSDTRECWISNTAGDLVLANGGDDNTPHCELKMFDGNIMRFNTANTERMRLDSSGRLLVGHTASEAMFYTGSVQVQGTNSSTSAITIKTNQNDSGGPALVLGKSRGALGSATAVNDDDVLGSIFFNGADGTDTISYGAEIRCQVDGTPGSNDMPGRLAFFTTADGAATSTERMRITSAGKIGINEDDPDGDLQVTTAGSADAQLKVGGSESTGNGMKITYSNSGNTSTIFKQNYHATNAGALMQFDSGLFYFRTGTSPTTALTLDSSQNATFAGTVSDSKGDLRKIPINAKSSSYTLISSDAGKTIRTTAGVTVPAGVFYEGEAITIFNDSGSDITITQGSNQTMYNAADAATGNRTLAGRGLCTVLCFDNNEFVISGAGLS
jgi:hypothetical protein